MDNEGLLEWAEYEVNKARAVLKRAERNRDERRKAVEKEKYEEVYEKNILTRKLCKFIDQVTVRMTKRNEFEIVYDLSTDWRRRGVSEEESNGV